MHTFTYSLILLAMLVLPLQGSAQAASAESAAQMALAQFADDARVLSVREKTNEQGQPYYEVQIISQGNVRIVSFSKI